MPRHSRLGRMAERGARLTRLAPAGLLMLTLASAGCEFDEAIVRAEGSRAPSVEPTEPEIRSANLVTVTLTDNVCSLNFAGERADPHRVEFTGVNETEDGWAVFDIGRLTGGHAYSELVQHVAALGSDVTAKLPGHVASLRPRYFQGSIDGTVSHPHGGNPGRSLLPVHDSPWTWSAPHGNDSSAARVPIGTYAVICYRGSGFSGSLVPAGIAGPVGVGVRPKIGLGLPWNGVDVGSIGVSDTGCTSTALRERVRADYIRLTVRNDTTGHNDSVAFDIGTIAEGHTFQELISHVIALRRIGYAGPAASIAPSFFDRSDAAEAFLQYPHGGMGPYVPLPMVLRANATGTWSGPSEKIGPIHSETFAVICSKAVQGSTRFRPVRVIGPIEVR